jgi:integrase
VQNAALRTTILTPAEIKVLVDGLRIRERISVLLAVSTGLRQSELYGLKWRDIDFVQGAMNVTRSRESMECRGCVHLFSSGRNS